MKTLINNNSRSWESGFTLLEMMVALGVLFWLLTAVYGSFSRTLRSKDIAEGRQELFAAGREAVLRIANDIEGAAVPGRNPYIFFRGLHEGGDPPMDTIQFVSVNRGGYGLNRVCPGLVVVSYSLEQLGDRSDLLMLRRDEFSLADLIGQSRDEPSIIDLLTGEDEGDRCAKEESRPLLYCEDDSGAIRIAGSCIRVAGLSFQYYDPEIGDFREEWDSEEMVIPGTQDRRIPSAVRVTLYLADDRGHFQEFTTVSDIPLGRDQRIPTPRATP